MIKTIVLSYSYGAVLGQLAIIIVVLLYLAKVLFKSNRFDQLRKTIQPYSYHLAFLLSLIATLASLFLSEAVKFQPCILCWYQRVMMYPQPILLYISLVRNERFLKPYLITMSVIGAVVSAYHYGLQRFPQSLYAPCNTDLSGVSCIKGYLFYFGYMSFPLMALTVFVLLIILMLFSNAQNLKHSK